MNIESPTETDALNSLNELSSILKYKDSDCKYVDHINLIRNYIEDVEKQRQEKRDLGLKEIYSEIIEEYYIKRKELIENLKEFINKNSLSSKEFLTGKNSTDSIRPLYYINDNPDGYDKNWVNKEFVIKIGIKDGYILLCVPMDGNPFDIGELYKVSSIINIITSDNIYDVNELSTKFYWLNSSNITYVWDDYNKCMHPTSLVEEAERIIEFAKKDYQWLVFTNSLFFIKELKLLAKKENLDIEYFNIYLKDHELEVERSDDLYSLNNLSLMNESIAQFNREISIYNPDFVD